MSNMTNEIETFPLPVLFVIIGLFMIIMIVIVFLMTLGSLWAILWLTSLAGFTDHPSKSIGRRLSKAKWWFSDYWWVLILLLIILVIIGLVVIFPDEIFGFFEDIRES